MSDYLQVTGSIDGTRFYPVSEGSNLTTATAAFRADNAPAGKLVNALPDPGAGFEWYEYTETTGTPGLWRYATS